LRKTTLLLLPIMDLAADGIIEEEEINYEYSDSERSSSGSSASSGSSSSGEEEEEANSRSSGVPRTSSHSDEKSFERAHSQLHSARSKEAPVNNTTWGQLNSQEEGNAEAQEAQAFPWIERMQKQKGGVLQVARDRPPKLNADSIPYKLTLLWMSGMAPPEVSQGHVGTRAMSILTPYPLTYVLLHGIEHVEGSSRVLTGE
jgi:hypothetical protein